MDNLIESILSEEKEIDRIQTDYTYRTKMFYIIYRKNIRNKYFDFETEEKMIETFLNLKEKLKDEFLFFKNEDYNLISRNDIEKIKIFPNGIRGGTKDIFIYTKSLVHSVFPKVFYFNNQKDFNKACEEITKKALQWIISNPTY